MKLQIAFVLALACVVAASPIARVAEQIWKNLEETETTTVIISFKKADSKAAVKRFESLKLTSRSAILDTQHAILKDHADVVQADVTDMLKKGIAAGKVHRLDQLWISAQLIVRDIDKEFVEKLQSHPDVESLAAEEFFPILSTIEGDHYDINDFNNTILNQWSIVNVNAPAAWARGFAGQNVVIGNIDTGARHTHVNLAPTYRANDAGEDHNYNWMDPQNGTPIPSDTNGHGTHCIGSHSGTGGIGVAPQSRWISCRGCGQLACSNANLLTCGNFMACPTNTAGGAPQCGRAPRIVSNSWGGGANSVFFDGILDAWRTAGIAGIFAIGNSGTGCSTAISPGDRPLAFGVGSTTEANGLSTFSSVGPAANNLLKPEVAAPGTSVISASHLTDTGLRTLSGTSMACPHVSGAVALVFQARPQSTVVAALNSITQSALAHVHAGRTCAGLPEAGRPNHHVGHGRIDANGAI